MCKDTEKEDELKSMQAAWETQQPGRLEKVRVHTDTSTHRRCRADSCESV